MNVGFYIRNCGTNLHANDSYLDSVPLWTTSNSVRRHRTASFGIWSVWVKEKESLTERWASLLVVLQARSCKEQREERMAPNTGESWKRIQRARDLRLGAEMFQQDNKCYRRAKIRTGRASEVRIWKSPTGRAKRQRWKPRTKSAECLEDNRQQTFIHLQANAVITALVLHL